LLQAKPLKRKQWPVRGKAPTPLQRKYSVILNKIPFNTGVSYEIIGPGIEVNVAINNFNGSCLFSIRLVAAL
jgi:hypothetical protein